MKPSPHRSSLFSYAVSKLTPDVFCHPVWVRFGKKETAQALNTVTDILSTVKILQREDPAAACQILLLCAVYQNHAGQNFNAFSTVQRALALSQSNHLPKEEIWALWGMCAVSIHQGKKEQACTSLIDLQAALNAQNEWILADFVDIFRQSLTQSKSAGLDNYTSIHDQAFESIFDFSFEWLFHWGVSTAGFNTELHTVPDVTTKDSTVQPSLTPSLFSMRGWQGRWQTFIVGIRGELNFQWQKNDTQPTRVKFSFWGTFLSTMRYYFADRDGKSQVVDAPSQDNPVTLLPAEKEKSPNKPKITSKKAAKAATHKARLSSEPEKGSTSVPVAVYMLGTFKMTIGEQAIDLPSTRGLSLLKYLLIHRKKHITREMLMDVFWPDSEPETARNSLDVALHSLRKALRSSTFMPVLLYQDHGYTFEPSLQIWLDVDEFERCVQTGQQLEARNQRAAALTEYETAISLYQGDFLEQNPYEEWTILDRERLLIAYLDTLDRLSHLYFEQERYAACIAVCQLITARDPCHENTHCLLMRCYSRQGQNHLALRQYHVCKEKLRTELGVDPAGETTKLFQDIMQRRVV